LTIKVGLGYDIHRLSSGRALYLGGIKIPHPAGLAGHSDGDCLVHALIDALLGAAGEPDIGRLFPDTDPAYKEIRSTALLAKVVSRLRRRRRRVLSADLVVVAQAPKLAPHIDQMKEALGPSSASGPSTWGSRPRPMKAWGSSDERPSPVEGRFGGRKAGKRIKEAAFLRARKNGLLKDGITRIPGTLTLILGDNLQSLELRLVSPVNQPLQEAFP
jgi:2-C-methyl-D-erythritol 2,4-cyclodiphosphate synthase